MEQNKEFNRHVV